MDKLSNSLSTGNRPFGSRQLSGRPAAPSGKDLGPEVLHVTYRRAALATEGRHGRIGEESRTSEADPEAVLR